MISVLISAHPSTTPETVSKCIDEAVIYMNAATCKRYNLDAVVTRALLQTLLTKGYTLSEIKRVLDMKILQWSNVDTMEKYLRPKTLFGLSNFKQYLVQCNIQHNGKR